jgi:hypothetical protein
MNNNEIESIRSLLGIITPAQKLIEKVRQPNGGLFCFSGGSNSGKSDLSKLLANELSILGIKCAFFDIENVGCNNLFISHGKVKNFNKKNGTIFFDSFFPKGKDDFVSNIESCIKDGYKAIIIDYLNLLNTNDLSSLDDLPSLLKRVADENQINIILAINSRKSTSELVQQCKAKSDHFAILCKDKNLDLYLSFLSGGDDSGVFVIPST